MATYRYWDVRRDVYEQCSNKPMKKYRSFADMKKLFKKSYWTVLILMIVFFLCYIALFLFAPNFLYTLIPAIGIFVLAVIGELFGEKMYNSAERKKELSEKSSCLEQYVTNIKNVLESHGINTKSQREVLKKECEGRITQHNKSYRSVSNKVFDMLIGVPLGALISALIYKSESSDIIVTKIIIIIVIGLMIIGIANAIKKLSYYSDGHFKDQYLLDALNELEYLSE